MSRKVSIHWAVVLLCLSMLIIAGVNLSAQDKPVTIKFYHSEDQYNKDMVAAFEKKNPNIKVQIVPVDFGNAEQTIKLGIISGNPVDVSFFWGTAIKTFVDAKMAEDLTPYLEADGGKWKNTFLPQFIDAGKVNGKYYAVSYQPVIETIFYNADLFTQYKIKVPANWNEFLSACETLKKNGLFGMSVQNTQHHQLLVFAYQLMLDSGKIAEITTGKVPFSGPNEAPGLRKSLEMLKEVYQKGYWYPGEGALTSTRDEVRAAFYQGKIGMLYDASSQLKTHSESAKFKVGVMKHPIVNKSGKYGLNVVTNALFVPANAAHKKEAIEFMKFYTSEEGQRITMSSWRAPVLKNITVDIPLMKELIDTAKGDNVVGYSHLQNLSAKVNPFVEKELVAAACSGQSIDEILKKLESLRLEIAK
jgi:ABC-type glycerol-3-phosphate transport system substrate-binding protein